MESSNGPDFPVLQGQYVQTLVKVVSRETRDVTNSGTHAVH